jgi:hypothetical protein
MSTDDNHSSMTLRRKLRQLGLSDPALQAAWPTWWSEDAEASPSAVSELRFSVARKLGLDPRSLLEASDGPRFLWKDEARFKHLTGESEAEQSAMTSFGSALARLLAGASVDPKSNETLTAVRLRKMLLGTAPFIGLAELLQAAWALGIPVVHLRVFPCERKRMAAMAARGGNHDSILLAKDSDYPAQISFYLAHEIGHVLLGHLDRTSVWLDVEVGARSEVDTDEQAADEFALELLTGQKKLQVLPTVSRFSGRQLAKAVTQASAEYQIEPGTLAMCLGYTTGNWRSANAAMPYIYGVAKPAWVEVNRVAVQQLHLELLSDDSRSYVSRILGESGLDEHAH